MTRLEMLLDKARKTNATRDAIDRKSGFGAPGDPVEHDGLDLTLVMHLRNAMAAIVSGLANGAGRGVMTAGDMDCVAEGFAMLEGLHIALDPLHRPYR